MKARAPAALLVAVLSTGARAAPGSTAFSILQMDADARAAALAGTYVARPGDANALQYNPAGLARMSGHEAAFMHSEFVEGVSQEHLAYASRRGWGAQLGRLDFGDTPRTTLSNPAGTGLGATGLSAMTAAGGYGLRLGSAAGAGFAIKYFKEDVDELSAQGIAFDLGGIWEARRVPGLTLGAAVRNLGPDARFESIREKLPLEFRYGATLAIRRLRAPLSASIELIQPRGDGHHLALGLECTPLPSTALRFGYGTRADAGPGVSFGLGWRGPRFGIDYAFLPLGELGSAHRFSILTRWGETAAPVAAVGAPSEPPKTQPAPENELSPLPSRDGNGDRTGR